MTPLDYILDPEWQRRTAGERVVGWISGPRLCECGCGRPTPIAKRTDNRYGHVPGQPIRFVQGHGAALARRRSNAELLASIAQQPNGCWALPNRPHHLGYVPLRRSGVSYQAHRFIYELLVGPIPAGLELDHLCQNKACVNPIHLEPVTGLENTRRSFSARTHCKNGHERTLANTRITPRGIRQCRVCQILTAQRRTARKRERIERESYTGRDSEGRLFLSLGPSRERLEEIAKTDPLLARYLDGDR